MKLVAIIEEKLTQESSKSRGHTDLILRKYEKISLKMLSKQLYSIRVQNVKLNTKSKYDRVSMCPP